MKIVFLTTLAVVSRISAAAIFVAAAVFIFTKSFGTAAGYFVVAWVIHGVVSGLAIFIMNAFDCVPAFRTATLAWLLNPTDESMPTVKAAVLVGAGTLIVSGNVALIAMTAYLL